MSGVRQENIYLSVQYIHQKYGYPVERLCNIVHLNRSSYYKWLKRSKSHSELENEQLAEWIKELYEEQNGILGYRQMTITINRENNVRYNQKRIRRLMRILNLQSVCRKKRYNYIKSTPEITAENILNREFYANKPNEKWLTGDTCYVYRQAIGIWWSDKFRPAIEAGANLILNLLFVKKFGVAGVLLATIVTMLTINLLWTATVLFKTYFKRSMKEYILRMLTYAVITCTCIFITYKTCSFIPGDSIFTFIGKIIICIIEPNLIMLIAYFKFPEFSKMKQFISIFF